MRKSKNGAKMRKSMAQRQYTQAELMAEHSYSRLQSINGRQLHGGFDESGEYVSPRTLLRWPAVRAWQAKLELAGAPLIDASAKLLSRENYPNHAQQKLLLKNGLGQTFWNALTITGIFEARGKALCEIDVPDFQDIIEEDISDTCTGHLHKGLLYAHGADEGGDPERSEVGAHDEMWFAVRDLAFRGETYPMPEIPDTLSRPSDGPLFPQIASGHGQLLDLLLNLLMIEVRAEAFFAFCCSVLRDPDLFLDHRKDAEEAVTLVERIRTDEAIHTHSLRVTLSEMRTFHFKSIDDSMILGADLIDPPWEVITEWHGKILQDLSQERARDGFKEQIGALPNGEDVWREFERIAS